MERSLWGQGCLSWDHVFAEPERFTFGTATPAEVHLHLERSHQALTESDYRFFRRHMSSSDGWRAFPEFRHSCVYLDIETDGGRGGGAG